MPAPYLKLLSEVQGKKICVVDGESVRRKIPKFMVSGHNAIYSEIPENEIWIDSMVPPEDWDRCAFHDACECYLMGQGLEKEKASTMADDLGLMFHQLAVLDDQYR